MVAYLVTRHGFIVCSDHGYRVLCGLSSSCVFEELRCDVYATKGDTERSYHV